MNTYKFMGLINIFAIFGPTTDELCKGKEHILDNDTTSQTASMSITKDTINEINLAMFKQPENSEDLNENSEFGTTIGNY